MKTATALAVFLIACCLAETHSAGYLGQNPGRASRVGEAQRLRQNFAGTLAGLQGYGFSEVLKAKQQEKGVFKIFADEAMTIPKGVCTCEFVTQSESEEQLESEAGDYRLLKVRTQLGGRTFLMVDQYGRVGHCQCVPAEE